MTPNEKALEIVMLTPTQEAMQWVWEQRKSTNSKDAISALDAVYQHLQKVTLEKEKEVMDKIYKDSTVQFNISSVMDEYKPFENYYNETFKTKQK